MTEIAPSNSIEAVVRRLRAYAISREDLPCIYRLEAQRAADIIIRLQRKLADSRKPRISTWYSNKGRVDE